MRHADLDEVRNLGARIIVAPSKPVEIDMGSLARVGVSVGAALDRDGTALLSDLMRQSNRAFYVVKTSGK